MGVGLDSWLEDRGPNAVATAFCPNSLSIPISYRARGGLIWKHFVVGLYWVVYLDVGRSCSISSVNATDSLDAAGVVGADADVDDDDVFDAFDVDLLRSLNCCCIPLIG